MKKLKYAILYSTMMISTYAYGQYMPDRYEYIESHIPEWPANFLVAGQIEYAMIWEPANTEVVFSVPINGEVTEGVIRLLETELGSGIRNFEVELGNILLEGMAKTNDYTIWEVEIK